jgi:hypothetical protein
VIYPDERSLAEQYRDAPFTILGVNRDSTPERLAAAIEREGFTWPIIYEGAGPDQPNRVRWKADYAPMIYLVDHEGMIRYKFWSVNGLERAVRRLVGGVPRTED